MSAKYRVKHARNPREAINELAALVDELLTRVTALEEAAGSWDEDWGEVIDDGKPPREPEPERAETNAERGETEEEFKARMERQHQEALRGMNNTDPADIVLPAPTEEKMDYRRMFERQQLRLQEMLESLGQDDPDVNWNDVYAKGGPYWLYTMNRELFMTYDEPVRRLMVADLEAESPPLAYQMALDVLKQPAGEPDFENGSGALAVTTVGLKK